MTDDSAEILFLCFPQEVIESSSGMGWDVNFLVLSIHHLLCRSRLLRLMVGLKILGWFKVWSSFPSQPSLRLLDTCSSSDLVQKREASFERVVVVEGQ